MSKAIFLDRDGVIIEDTDLITSLSQVRFISNIASSIIHLKNKGFRIFIVTNQTVVSRGLLSYEEMVNLNELILNKIFFPSNYQNYIDKVYICPHHPHGEVLKYRKQCECRKPKPGMLFKAQKEFNIDLSSSFMVGDRVSDIVASNLAGVKSILLQTDQKEKPMIVTDQQVSLKETVPDYTAISLEEAVSKLFKIG